MRRIRYIKIGVGACLLAAALITADFHKAAALILFSLALLAAGADVFLRALRNLFSLSLLDESFLMSVAAAGAFAIGEYPEAVAVMLLYQIGEAFQSYAVGKSRRSIRELMNIRPDTANLLTEGEIRTVSPDEIHTGDTIVVQPGERVPLDALITEGATTLDVSALTGESVPAEANGGCEVLSGSINLTGVITCRVTREFEESTASRILELVENASGKKSKSENFITAFSRWYTPIVVALAFLLAAVPPLLIRDACFADWLYRALTFLVISCPCALVISVPMSFFAALGSASRRGILIKGSNYLEALSRAHTFVFDKTGTLTKGKFAVSGVCPKELSVQELLELAAHAECFSRHPIAACIRDSAPCAPNPACVSNVSELSGFGVVATVNGREVTVGNAKLLSVSGIEFEETETSETCVYVAVGGKYAGYIKVSDEIKPGTAAAVDALKAVNGARLVMLTGDRRNIGQSVARNLGFDGVEAELLPGDKVSKLEEILQAVPKGKNLVYVGDGINDAPVLARADIGIAMGSLGSDAAIEAADIVIMTDELTKIPEAMRLSVRTLRIVKQNIVFSLSVKILVLLLGALGFAFMWAAVFADVGVAVIAIANAMRLLKTE